MACSPASDMAKDTLNHGPFHTRVARIDSTDPAAPFDLRHIVHGG